MLAVERRHMHLSSLPAVGRAPMCAHAVQGSGLAVVEAVEAVEVLSLPQSDTALSSQSAELEAKTVEVE